MTGEQFEARVDRIIAEHRGHAAHRALDLLTNDLLLGMGGGFERGTRKWLAAIEGHHAPDKPYPLGSYKRWSGAELRRAARLIGQSNDYRAVGIVLGRSGQSVRRALQRLHDRAAA